MIQSACAAHACFGRAFEDGAETEIVDRQGRGRFGFRRGVSGVADQRIASEYFPRPSGVEILIAQMDSGRPGSQRDIDTVVDDQTATRRFRLTDESCGQLGERARGQVFRAQLHETCAAACHSLRQLYGAFYAAAGIRRPAVPEHIDDRVQWSEFDQRCGSLPGDEERFSSIPSSPIFLRSVFRLIPRISAARS